MHRLRVWMGGGRTALMGAALAAAALGGLLAGGGAVVVSVVVSFVGGAVAVFLPFWLFLKMARFAILRRRSARAFSLWSVKFSLTVLLLAGMLRLLHESSLLAALAFLGGATVAVLATVVFGAGEFSGDGNGEFGLAAADKIGGGNGEFGKGREEKNVG